MLPFLLVLRISIFLLSQKKPALVCPIPNPLLPKHKRDWLHRETFGGIVCGDGCRAWRGDGLAGLAFAATGRGVGRIVTAGPDLAEDGRSYASDECL